jgi:hypothetical protein
MTTNLLSLPAITALLRDAPNRAALTLEVNQ